MPTLKTILRVNAASCLGFGALFALLPGAVAASLGTPPAPAWLVAVVGTVLIFHGLHLLHASWRELPSRYLILYFSFGDFAWVLATLTLVVSGLWITRPEGQAVALLVATFVGAVGVMQMTARKALGHC